MADTPNYESDEYIKHKGDVSLVDNAYNGVKTSVAHLLQYSKESNSDYKDRQDSATLDNYVGRTADSMRNIIFRKDINTKELEGSIIEPYLNTIDLNNNLNEFTKQTTLNVIKDGYAYILADAPTKSDDIKTQYDANKAGIRPYLINIERDRVINWTMNDDGSFASASIRFGYEVEKGYKTETKDEIRHYRSDGFIEIWRDNAIHLIIEMGVQFIPLVKIGTKDIPYLYDLARLNINHMNRSSELDRYVRIGGAPFLATFGSLSGDGVKVLGVDQGLSFASTQDSDVKWIEMSGANAAMIENRIETYAKQMVNASISLTTSSTIRTATEVEQEGTEAESRLINIAVTLEDGLNKALEYMAEFASGTIGENGARVNRDYDSNILTVEQQNALLSYYDRGVISWDRLIDLLEQGEVLPFLDDMERATEKNLINDLGMSSEPDDGDDLDG